MKLDRSTQRSDFEEFNKFLGLRGGGQTPRTTQSVPFSTRSLAMVYPEKQHFIKIYDTENALVNGTIFEELDKPFNMSKCKDSGGGCL